MRYTNKIFFAFDGDLAGGKAAWKAVENTFPIIREDINIHFVFCQIAPFNLDGQISDYCSVKNSFII